MATTFGTRPESTVADSRGNVLSGVVLGLYPTQADAAAQTSPVASVTTGDDGLWPYTDASSRSGLWVRDPAGKVWPVEAAEAAAGLDGKADAAATTAALALKADDAATTASLAAKVAKGELIYSAADYASLGAAITAAPAGSTIKLAPGTTYSVNALATLTKDLTFVGDGSRSSIIDAGANAYGFTLPGVGTGCRITFRNIGFIGSTSAQVRLWRDRHMSARFIDCRFSGFTQYAIENSGTDLLCVRCEFDGSGTPGTTNAIFHQYGADRITLRDCTFRYLFRGLYCTDTNGPAKDVSISGCTFDGGWFLLNSAVTNSGGTVTYAATTLTDSAASFAALAANTPVRALTVKQTGTLTTVARGRLTDTAANFTTAAVKRGDFLRVSGKFGIVDEVVSSTVVKLDKWIDSTTYEDCEPPASSTAYTVYGLIIGRVASNTSTVLTVDRWRDWDGAIATPSAGTLYEVVPKGDYQCFVLRADHVTITGNTFKRGYADQIAPLNSRNVVVANNNIYDGQDVGITYQPSTSVGANAIITGNRIMHQGTAGIWCSAPDTVIASNNIYEPNWMSGPSDTYAGIMLETGADRVLVNGNVVKRVNHPNALKAFHCNGTTSGIRFVNNQTNGYTTHLVITGANVTNVSGSFEPDAVVSLVSSAVGPRGEFSGAGVPAIPASAGSTFRRTDGGAATSFYVKETSSASTTWVAK